MRTLLNLIGLDVLRPWVAYGGSADGGSSGGSSSSDDNDSRPADVKARDNTAAYKDNIEIGPAFPKDQFGKVVLNSSTKKKEVPSFKNLTAAAKAGYHGQAVNIGGKLQKVKFEDKAYDKRMSNASAKKTKSSGSTNNNQQSSTNNNQQSGTNNNSDTSASTSVNKPVTKVPPLDGGKNKPNFLGYGYYNSRGVWIPPDIDMQDGGGPGISGAVFGSKGGVQADTDGDMYVSAAEAKAAADKGIFKYGIGRVSNAVGATPFGSGRAPTGIAGAVAGGGMLGAALGMEYTPREQMFGEGGQSMTQAQVDAYMADVRARQQQANEDQRQLMLHGSPADGGSGGAGVDYGYDDDIMQPVQTTPPGFTGEPPVTTAAAYDPMAYSGPVNSNQFAYDFQGFNPYLVGGPLPTGNYQPPNLFAEIPAPITQGIGSLRGIV